MSRASRLLHFHEEVEKEAVNYAKHGDDWSEVPVDLTLQGTKGFVHNDQGCPEKTAGTYFPDGKRGSGYGSGNGETQKSGV
jgi:hypothetical protein